MNVSRSHAENRQSSGGVEGKVDVDVVLRERQRCRLQCQGLIPGLAWQSAWRDRIRVGTVVFQVHVHDLADISDLAGCSIFQEHRRWHSALIAAMLWLTSSACATRLVASWIRPRHLLKGHVPHRRTSSTSSISGSRWAATANANLTYIPLESLDRSVQKLSHAGKVHDSRRIASGFPLSSCQ